jgi:dihydrofolate reductase
MARGRVIGQGGRMPWHLPADLRHFKATTLGKPVVMGRKTFESIGCRPLPGRSNLVVTRSDPARFEAAGALVFPSLDAALAGARGLARRDGAGEVAVIGGGEVYRQALPLADRMVLTEIDLEAEGDTLFPAFDPADWREAARDPHPAEGGRPAYAFVTYERRRAPARAATRTETMQIELKLIDPDRWERIRAAHLDLSPDLDPVPRRHSDMAAGHDLIACIEAPIALRVGDRPVLVPTGIAIHIGEPGVDAELHPRSGLATKFGVVLANLTGVIDADYQGQVMVGLVRLHPGTEGGETVVIRPGDRVAQLVLKRVVQAEWKVVEEFGATTARGAGGFGSTGIGAPAAEAAAPHPAGAR